MQVSNRKTDYKVLLFLINPFLSALYSLKNIRDGGTPHFLYLWFLIFGIGFCAMSESADSYRYVEDFMTECRYTWPQYVYQINEYLTFESNIKDIYTLTVNVFVGTFTDNYHWTFFIYSIVFGFFYIKSMQVFLANSKIIGNIFFFLLLFLFCFSNPIYNINGVRFWTASWIGVYAVLKAVMDKKAYYLLLLLVTPLIHGTFSIWIAMVLCALFLGRFHMVWKVLFVVSSFVSAVSFLSVLDDYSDLLPQFMQNQIWAYTQSDEALKKMSGELTEQLPLYAQVFNALPTYFMLMLSYIVVFNRRLFISSPNSRVLFNVYVAMVTIANFLSGIPSMGRFLFPLIPLLVVLWAMNDDKLRKFDNVFYLIPFIYWYAVLQWLRRIDAVTELFLYLLPAPITIIKYLFL